MNIVFVSIGSNICKEHNIVSCIETLRQIFGALTISPIYQSPSQGFKGSDFYNAVVSFGTDLKPHAIRDQLRDIEKQHKRTRGKEKFVSRTLDLDILLYGNECTQADQIELPNPEINQYLHVLFPLADIAPELTHPVLNQSYSDLRKSFKQESNYSIVDYDLLFSRLNQTKP